MCSPLTKHLAEFNQAERSEAVAPEPREGRKRKLEATELEANKHGANQHLREAGKRALHVRNTDSQLGENVSHPLPILEGELQISIDIADAMVTFIFM